MQAEQGVAWSGYLTKKVCLEGMHGGATAVIPPRFVAIQSPVTHSVIFRPQGGGKSFFGRSNWQRRFYTLFDDGMLRYYASESSKSPKVRYAIIRTQWFPAV